MKDEKESGKKRGFVVQAIGIKRQAVAELESGMYRRSEMREKYGITDGTLRLWIQKVKGDVFTQADPDECSETMRLAANEVLCGLSTVEQALERHGLQSAGRLRLWVEQVRKENRAMRGAISGQSCDIAPMTKSKGKGDEVARLRQELEAARMRVVALETLIDVAARDFGVNILKKHGTKQSRN